MNNLHRQLNIKVRKEIEMLLSHKIHPKIHKDTDGVWVFSGPGTFFEPLDKGQKPWMQWMDRYRILYGATIVREVTAKRLHKQSQDVTRTDILGYGPVLIYNGTHKENQALRLALKSALSIIPYEKVIIIDKVKGANNQFREIKNTKDQILSLPKDIAGSGKKIQKRIALVSNSAHIERILRYLEKYKPIPEYIKVEVFPLKLPKKSEEAEVKEEMDKIWKYFQKGDLSWFPFPVEE